jgi:hypothetical protein
LKPGFERVRLQAAPPSRVWVEQRFSVAKTATPTTNPCHSEQGRRPGEEPVVDLASAYPTGVIPSAAVLQAERGISRESGPRSCGTDTPVRRL